MAPRGRRWFLAVLIMLMAIAGSPALWAQAQPDESASPEFRASWTELDVAGITGDYIYYDLQGNPGALCANDVRTFPGFVDIRVVGPDVFPSFAYSSQIVASGVTLLQVRPGGSLQVVLRSDLVYKSATPSSPAVFPIYTFTSLPLGPVYVAVVEIFWFDELGVEEGHVFAGIDFYRPRIITQNGTTDLTVDDACYSPNLPIAATNANRGTVNSTLSYELLYFPLFANVNVRWDSLNLGTVPTDEFGYAAGSFRIPASPMGVHRIRWFTGSWSVATTFTVVPRIKLIPSAVARGQVVNVSLRGYAARETVRIRWKRGSSWIELGRIRTSGTGSANIAVPVPAWAPDGPASVRGDSLNAAGGRAQTNAVFVSGGTPLQAASEATPSPSPTTSPTAMPTLAPPASPTVEPTVTLEPTATVEPTQEPTTTPTAEPTATPTDEPTPSPEPSPTEEGEA